jgi:ABC-type glycerol-3-phosphate transport system substrate-binding protein
MNLSKRQLFILAGIGIAILFLVIAIIFGRHRPGAGAELTVWGVFDTQEAYQEIFANFRRETGISAVYIQKDIATYETDLINALAAGRGPDILMIHNSWLPKHSDKIVPAPTALVAPHMVRELYPNVVADDFVAGDQVWALPLSIDTLALFYNRHLFNQAGIVFPPATWEELVAIAPRLTLTDADGRIEQSAIAMGTTFNINRPSDILAMLMLQVGSSIVDRNDMQAVFNRRIEGAADRSAGEYALEFYLQFSNPARPAFSWDTHQHYSIDAFSEGTLAMMLSYAFQIPTIRAKGPFVDFGVSMLPQPAGRRDRVDYANYWGFAVSNQSWRQFEAWQLISFMTTRIDSAEIYFRNTGRPPALRVLIQENMNRPVVGVFSQQALTAKSWFQPDPARVESIFWVMMESTRRRELSPGAAVERAVNQINLLLDRFRR